MGATIEITSLEQWCDLMCGAPEDDGEEVSEMPERLTKFDKTRGCYVIRPDVPQGEHIQRLGMYEDRDETCRRDFMMDDEPAESECGKCGHPVGASYNFCPNCGQRVGGYQWRG